ncbi:type IV secretory system conjugative DNA transfer family protein [Methyloraptor flagellatus]|uniref:Type IV secretory system conjugative DNA transfer family protein n=1 Tax=Methyloraptor flagellatus TaxID=3162530 RepID=A0AAU7XGR0_9HYPH
MQEGLLILFGMFAVFVAYFAVGGIGGIAGRLVRIGTATRPRQASGAFAAAVRSDPRAGSGEGFSRAEALEAIDAFYANDLHVVAVMVRDLVPHVLPQASVNRMGEAIAQRVRHAKRDPDLPNQIEAEIGSFVEQQAIQALAGTVLARTLRDLSDQERATLRLADMLRALERLSDREVLAIRLPILWNDGKCHVEAPGGFERADRVVELRRGLADLILAHGGHAAMAAERTMEALRAALEAPTVAATDRAVLERYLFAGARWMTPADTPERLMTPGRGRSALVLGTYPNGEDFLYDMAESLITIASPGSGKSQAHVLRNLLRCESGAMVLDIKGEMFRDSSAWRATLGPVVKFAPGDPESVSLNPLDWIRPDHIWDDADRIAPLLYVAPDQAKADAYFEGRAISLIQVALAYVAFVVEPTDRNMYSVVVLLYQLADPAFLQAWMEYFTGADAIPADPERGIEGREALVGNNDLPQLTLEVGVIANLPHKQREGVIDGTRRMLQVWLSPEVKAITGRTEFDAAALRAGGTLYLCVNDDDIERLASVVRVVVGMMMRGLQRDGTGRDKAIVTFFLDEMPRLQTMPLIETMLDIGRGYGIRLWLFAQNFGQLQARYKNAGGILRNCAVRCFMNIDHEDGRLMSDILGEREGLLDGRRKPLAEPWELSGPEFEDKILVFHRSGLPARLTKVFAFNDPVCKARLGSVGTRRDTGDQDPVTPAGG